MKTRMLWIMLLLLLSLSLSGCWDYVEYENLAQITGIGMDYNAASQEVTITIQYPSIKKGNSDMGNSTSSPKWIVHSATDTTLLGALNKLQEVVPQRMFYGYLKVIVIGEAAAKYDLMEMVDDFTRTPTLHSSAYVVITPGKAEDVLSTTDPNHSFSSLALNELIHLAMNTGAAFPVTLNEFRQMLAIGGWEATAPRVISIAAKPGKEAAKGGEQAHMKFNEERIGTQRVDGMAAFKGAKFAGWLEAKESRGFGWITGKRLTTYEVSAPTSDAGTEDRLYYRINEANGKIKAKLVQNKPEIYIAVQVTADLRKYYRNKGTDFLSAEEIAIAEQLLADSIRSDIEAALQKGQKDLQTDIFGFGFALFRENPGVWQQEYAEKWAEVFPEIPVQVHVTAKVTNTGISTRKLIIK